MLEEMMTPAGHEGGNVQHPAVLPMGDRPDAYLQQTSLADVAPLQALVGEDREHLQTYQRWAKDATNESLEQAVRQAIDDTAAGTWLQYRLMHRNETAGDDMMGTVTYYDIDPSTRSAKFGYWIVEAYEGQGYVSAASRTMIDYGFTRLGLDTIELMIDPSNLRSERLAEHLGAVPTGRFEPKEAGGEQYHVQIWEICKA